MMFQVNDMILALPEMFMLGMACALLLVVAFTGKKGATASYWLSQLILVATAVLIYQAVGVTEGQTFNGTYIKDTLSDVLKLSICMINIVVLLYSRRYLQDRGLFKGEYYVLAIFSTLGMLVMVSAYHFLTLYLGLELLSLCLYAMVALNRDSKIATEAAMKYFILGALASGMLLYGMSIIYGATGSLSLPEIAASVNNDSGDLTVLTFGIVFLVVGLGFKFGAVPFHMWVPDVYHGAPTAVTLFIATAPKVAAFAMIIRILVDGLGSLQEHWQGMLIMLSVLSMIIGNLVAIAQTNIKRLFAYSTISHVGFIFLGLLAGTAEGYAAAMFYVIVYALMSLGGFGMILLLSRSGFEAENIADYQGLGRRNPWYAFLMLLLMFSMAGVPPMIGFYAKLEVINAIVNVDLISVAIVAILMSVIGAFYYLRVIKVMYFEESTGNQRVEANLDVRVILSVNALSVLGLGLFPNALMGLCARVFA